MSGQRPIIVAGGGLAGCLTALALNRVRADTPVLLLEEQPSLGGHHTWSFFDSDVDAAHRWLVDPLVVRHWPGHSVAFPGRTRDLPTGYNSITSERLNRMVREALPPEEIRTGAKIAHLTTDAVELVGGERLEGCAVIDARGASQAPGMDLAWQKFVGWRCLLREPHRLEQPVIMDACVDQADGYRFVYCLPFGEREVLIEDTYYHLTPELDRALLKTRIADYAAGRGWEIAKIVAEEEGVLPIALGGSIDALWPGPVPRIGMAGGFFQPTTGYSLPDAVRVALLIAHQPQHDGASLLPLLRDFSYSLWKDRAFYRRLNRMLFHAADPAQRYKVLEHFYRLDADVIARFYAGRITAGDRIRILTGKPPVPVGRALRALIA